MQDSDMVLFQGKDDGVVLDLWSDSFTKPNIDEQNDYEFEATEGDGLYDFVAYRDLDTGDQNDIVIACGKNHTF